jgi:hypothetical protein
MSVSPISYSHQNTFSATPNYFFNIRIRRYFSV